MSAPHGLEPTSRRLVGLPPKEIATMRLDADLLRCFRRERGYQIRINAILRFACCFSRVFPEMKFVQPGTAATFPQSRSRRRSHNLDSEISLLSTRSVCGTCRLQSNSFGLKILPLVIAAHRSIVEIAAT